MAAQPAFHEQPLYGGALTVNLPTTFIDASDLRQVPDHQEVFLDNIGYTSIVFDLLDRLDAGGDGVEDGSALMLHLADLLGDSPGEEVRVWEKGEVTFAKLPPNTPSYSLLATDSSTPPTRDARGALAQHTRFTAILLLLVRLEAQKTDLLVAISVPHVKDRWPDEMAKLEDGGGGGGPLLERARALREEVLGSLAVRDWGLFL